MCGIAGIISPHSSIINIDILQRMGASVSHRGPDGEGYWINSSENAGFAHRRLSVIDIGESGAQPMHYLKRYTIVYNGEIYNYIELKQDLLKKGFSFNSSSDTEVILACYACYKEDCVKYFDGMFAFAIWDEQEQTLYCARDRFGEKPFYYYYDGINKAFYFGSEIKALRAAGISEEANNKLLLSYLSAGYTSDVTDPSATFDINIKKLPAAHWLKFSFQLHGIAFNKYWDIDPSRIIKISLKETVEKFSELFSISVKRRLRSDVSLGASLSGGLDSSSVVSEIFSLQPEINLKTFTAVFPGYEKNESANAELISRKYNAKNFTTDGSADDFINNFEKLLFHQEEPFTSASVYAQYKVFELAKYHNVTVLLDGQGADETIAGYNKYKNWRMRSILPAFTAKLLSQKEKNKLEHNKEINTGFINAYKSEPYKPVVRGLNDLLYFNTFRSGLEELLRYADRNSMAHGREVRLPF